MNTNNINLSNKYVLAGIVSLIATIGLYIVNRKADDKVQYMTYLKHFVLIYLLSIALLYFKPSETVKFAGVGGGPSTTNGNYQIEMTNAEPNF
jgi:uncharacterized membrane protein